MANTEGSTLDNTSMPIASAVEKYLTACRVEGKTAKTLRDYREKLGGVVASQMPRRNSSVVHSARNRGGHTLRPNRQTRRVKPDAHFSEWRFALSVELSQIGAYVPPKSIARARTERRSLCTAKPKGTMSVGGDVRRPRV